MAYVSKETKAKIATALKTAKLPATLKYTLAVQHHSTLVLTIRQAPISVLDDYIGLKNTAPSAFGDLDNAKAIYASFEKGYYNVNTYHMKNAFEGKTLKMLQKIMETIQKAGDWFDKSDSMTDYFHTAFYIELRFGSHDKPCTFVGKRRPARVAPGESNLAKALKTLMTPGFGGAAAPVVDTNVVPFPTPAPVPVKSEAEIEEFARKEMVRRFVEKMKQTAVAAALSDAALETLAEAAVSVVMIEAK